MHKKRLVKQLFLSYLGITLVAVILVGLYGSHEVNSFYLDQTAEDLEARARLCRREIIELVKRGELAQVDAICKELGKAANTRITVILPSGDVAGDTDEKPANMDNHNSRPEVIESREGSVGRQTRYSMTLQKELMYVAVAMRENDSLVAVIRTSIPVTAIDEALEAIHLHIVIVSLLTAGVIAAVSFWISMRIGAPLRELREGAERFARGELDRRLPLSGPEEISTLAEAMNSMAEQLDERIRTILRQQNELEAVLSSMQEGVLALDTEGVILNLNQTCATLLNLDRSKSIGRLVHEVVRKADLVQFVESALANSDTIEGEIQIHGPQDRWLDAQATALHDSHQKRIGVLIVLHDVTRLHRLENVRRDFVANVSHELRTPITSIKGFVETLLSGALDDKENAERFLKIVLKQSNRLDAIIGDLLTLSRLEKETDASARLELGSVHEVVSAAVEMCEKEAADKQIGITQQCEPDLTAEINSPLLEQAVMNLVDNAIKYSGAGSNIRVTAGRDQSAVVIRVEDEGCGIETRHLPRLFERFYRADKARSRELGGTGLGLAIVKHITLAHNGSVDVESRVGSGSTFTIRIPSTSPYAAPPA